MVGRICDELDNAATGDCSEPSSRYANERGHDLHNNGELTKTLKKL